jgi:hypothetical protein
LSAKHKKIGCLSYIRPQTKVKIVRGAIPTWVERHSRKRYVVAAVLSVPFWVKLSDFDALIAERREKTESTGRQHTFDHIVPLNHPDVCGLTVPWNLRVIIDKHNFSKGNNWDNGSQLELNLQGGLNLNRRKR